MNLTILNKNQKQEIVSKLRKQFGIKNLDGTLVKIGPERIFLFQGNMGIVKKLELERNVSIERIGVYLGKFQNEDFRLSIEGVHLFKDQITKNVFDLNSDQAEQWIKGEELNIKPDKRGFLIMKYKDDFIGTGKASENKIGNYIPKNRRLKSKV